ncbi:MAG: type II toxin-antitoxin system HicB family antitoxin [Planctomycetaceae bacterium]|nr:type II toxin-antitoxin system HicB family antitoxin [Planctomycetaceae bacterium]
MATRTFTMLTHREDDMWVSLCPELDVASQGGSVEEAQANLREAVGLFLETASPEEIQQRLDRDVHLDRLEVTIG